MKTIKQIADELGVSKQAVQKRLAREPLYTCIQPYICIQQGTKYIAEQGVNLIIATFSGTNPTTLSIDKKRRVYRRVYTNVHSDVYSKQPSANSDIIKLLNDNLLTLQKQLEIKDKQIEELTATVKLQAESINSAHKNELAETIIDGQKALIGNNPKEKQGFFKRLFKNKKD